LLKDATHDSHEKWPTGNDEKPRGLEDEKRDNPPKCPVGPRNFPAKP